LKDQSASIYGQTDFKITDKLNLTVGLRYTHDDKGDPTYYAGASSSPVPGILPPSSASTPFGLCQRALPACVPKSDPGYIPSRIARIRIHART